MTLRIYNTLTRKKEDFIPIDDKKVRMYVCGMTVYSDAHIGHARTYLAFDIVRRYLEYKGYEVLYVQNITDVDDKIISSANERGMDPLEYSRRYTERCLRDLDSLGIRRANIYPKASENVNDMIEMINKILENGYGYTSDGDVYFSVKSFKDYGKLSRQKIKDMVVGARVSPDEKKRDALDFALWKAAKPGEPKWESPWGKGRPGWHIECTTMSAKYLGLPFDIHGGGQDLIFPHHENEIAQAEAATGKEFARYWMHVGLLTINGEKMSKSLGNIITIKEVLKKYNPEVVRFFLASIHYRKPPNYTKEALENAKNAVEKIHRLHDILLSFISREDGSSNEYEDNRIISIMKDTRKRFEDAMDDDFNTPQAFAVIFDFIGEINKFLDKNLNPTIYKKADSLLTELCSILTILQDGEEDIDKDALISILKKYSNKDYNILSGKEIIELLIKIRENARSRKDWKLADSIRSDLLSIGFEIQDSPKGTLWRKKRAV